MQPVQPPGGFQPILNQFEKHFSWPRFVVTYSDGTTERIPKLPSPLELLARLSGANPPADLDPVPQWPTNVWAPIQALRDNWATYTSSCSHSAGGPPTFCDALLDVKQIVMDNYANYQGLFTSAGPCFGTPVDATPDRILLHVYGWTPWTEAESGTGCPQRQICSKKRRAIMKMVMRNIQRSNRNSTTWNTAIIQMRLTPSTRGCSSCMGRSI
jgi:hypothetical protein